MGAAAGGTAAPEAATAPAVHHDNDANVGPKPRADGECWVECSTSWSLFVSREFVCVMFVMLWLRLLK